MSCLKFRRESTLSPVMPEILNQASRGLKYCGPLIETFRGDGTNAPRDDKKEREGGRVSLFSASDGSRQRQ